MPKLKPELEAVTIECGIEEYRIRVGNKLGSPAEYGDPATVTVNGYIYTACVHETNSGKRISLLPGSLWIVKGVAEPCSFTQYDETAGNGDSGDEDSEDEEEPEGDDDEEAESDTEDEDGDSDSDDSEEDEEED